MSSIITALTEDPPRECALMRAVNCLRKADRDVMLQAIDGTDMGSTRIVMALKAGGYKVSRTSVYEHRKGICCCD